MAEQFDPAWEYYAPDPEVAEALGGGGPPVVAGVPVEYAEDHRGRMSPVGFRVCRAGRLNSPCTRLAHERRPETRARDAAQCGWCRELFHPGGAGSRFCGRECYARWRAEHLGTWHRVVCPCGWVGRTRDPDRRYCSLRCAARLSPLSMCVRRLPASVACARCRTGFTPKATRTRFCSRRCGTAGNGAPRTLPDRLCRWCRVPFQPARAARTFCRPSCARSYGWARRRAGLKEPPVNLDRPPGLVVGARVAINTPENPRLHGTEATVVSLEAWGAHLDAPAAATGRFRACWDEVTPEAPRPVPAGGFTGSVCLRCGSSHMVRSGSCERCEDCGETTGCS